MKREVNQMKRTKLRLRLAVAATTIAMIVTTAGAFACTGVYIGKNVSKEGTTVIARSEDQGTSNYEKMFKVQKRVTKSGRYLKDTGESQKGFKVPLPKTTYKYTFVPDNTGEGDGMEDEVGFPLLIRSKTGVQPTGECRKLIPVLNQLARTGDLFTQQVNDINGLLTGKITVGTSYDKFYPALAHIIADFCREYPAVTAVITDGTSSQLSHAVADLNADFCIISRREGKYDWIPLMLNSGIDILKPGYSFKT